MTESEVTRGPRTEITVPTVNGTIPAPGPDDPPDPMIEALTLARRGRCGASPNPMVGAVVTDAAGRVVGRGWHARCGGPHAEVSCLTEAGARARGGTLWVTLEPCNHHGRTPPCSEAVVDSGVSRVVIAMADPNPTACGGADRIKAAGIDVQVGHLEDQARRLNRRWLRSVADGRPWVTQKAAVTLDGRIATRDGDAKWITGEPARRRSLELREEHDAILIEIGTVLADDPRLTRRLGMNPSEDLRRIVLDSLLRTPSSSRIVTDHPDRTLIAHTAAAGEGDRERLEAAGVTLIQCPATAEGRVEVSDLLPLLTRRFDIAALLVEGGGEVHGAFNDADLVDEVVYFVAPMVFGGAAPAAVQGRGVARIAEARRFVFVAPTIHGSDVELRGLRPDGESVEDSGDDRVHRAD
jgi:diaminohydroxyphosphoribosylaminopyrimidine deaminase/5-amino-6-(5-phosphoribosylamino)uracil reductase